MTEFKLNQYANLKDGVEHFTKGPWDSDLEKYPDMEYNFTYKGYDCRIVRDHHFYAWTGWVKIPKRVKSYSVTIDRKLHEIDNEIGFHCVQKGDRHPKISLQILSKIDNNFVETAANQIVNGNQQEMIGIDFLPKIFDVVLDDFVKRLDKILDGSQIEYLINLKNTIKPEIDKYVEDEESKHYWTYEEVEQEVNNIVSQLPNIDDDETDDDERPRKRFKLKDYEDESDTETIKI